MTIQPKITNQELQKSIVTLSSRLRVQRRIAKHYYERMNSRPQYSLYKRMWSRTMNRCKRTKHALSILVNLLHRRLFICSSTAVPVPQKYQSLSYSMRDIITAIRLARS